MKIGIFLGDGLIALKTLNFVIPKLRKLGISPLVYKTTAPKRNSHETLAIQEIEHLESGLLNEVVNPFFDGLFSDGMTTKTKLLPLQSLAKKWGFDVVDVSDVNSDQFIQTIERDNDLIGAISIRSYPIFKPEIIRAIRNKGFFWNLHTGLLPQYRGVFIAYRALENKEKKFGWTLHEINRGIDTGNIIATDSLPLNAKLPVLNTYLNMCEKGSNMIIGAIKFFLKTNMIMCAKQNNKQAQYYTFPTEHEFGKYELSGFYFAKNIVDLYLSYFAEKNTYEYHSLKFLLESDLPSSSIAPPLSLEQAHAA